MPDCVHPSVRACSRRPCLALLALIALGCATAAVAANGLPGASNAVISVNLNSEPKGEFVVWVTADGRYLIKVSDLIAMGIRDPRGEHLRIDDEAYLVLQSLERAVVKLDEKSQTFDIDSDPDTLGKQAIDLLPRTHSNTLVPKNDSMFLNYRAGINGGTNSTQTLSLYQELGAWYGDLLLLSDGLLTATSGSRFVRNMTSLNNDDRGNFERTTVGDFFTTTGQFGSVLTLGGFSIAKLYSEQPNFIKHPMASFTGSTTLPAEATIFLNGLPIRTQKISPGEFDLQNLNYFGGSQGVQVVVKDSLGRTQTFDYRYYFSDDLLRENLQEYNYGIGLARKNYGVDSFDYGTVGGSFYHRYGYSDDLTLGVRGDLLASNYNSGPFATFRLGQLGVLSGNLAFSRGRSQQSSGTTEGEAVSVRYSYQSGRFLLSASNQHYSRGYSPSTGFPTADRIQSETDLSVGYGSARIGSVGLGYSNYRKYVGDNAAFFSFNYSRPIPGKANIFATYNTASINAKGAAFFIGIAWSPNTDYGASISSQKQSGGEAATVIESGRNTPIGEGAGYRVAIEHGASLNAASPAFQYNSRVGSITANLRAQSSATDTINSYDLAYAGSILHVEDQPIGFSRPVNDSFGFVQVGDLENVRVYQNNQEIGKTDPLGRVFLPFMSSFVENQISINDKDIPINYHLAEVEKFVSPNYRSGNLVKFTATRIQAITGKLKVLFDGERYAVPAEYIEINLELNGKVTSLATGRGGEFYAENLSPGNYRVSLKYKNHGCEFSLAVPVSTELLVDLKEQVCNADR